MLPVVAEAEDVIEPDGLADSEEFVDTDPVDDRDPDEEGVAIEEPELDDCDADIEEALKLFEVALDDRRVDANDMELEDSDELEGVVEPDFEMLIEVEEFESCTEEKIAEEETELKVALDRVDELVFIDRVDANGVDDLVSIDRVDELVCIPELIKDLAGSTITPAEL